MCHLSTEFRTLVSVVIVVSSLPFVTISSFGQTSNNPYEGKRLSTEEFQKVRRGHLEWLEAHKDDWQSGRAREDKRRAKLTGADLTGIDLGVIDLIGINLGGADLSRTKFSGSMIAANLTGADLSRADMFGADLSGASLSDANLGRANLSSAKLSLANLTGADLSGADMYLARLSKASLTGADLTGANLGVADLAGARLTGANLTGANLTRANLAGADLTGVKLTDANLREAILTDANLIGANLTGAKLTEAMLTDANLSGAKLTGAKLTGIDLNEDIKDVGMLLGTRGLSSIEIGQNLSSVVRLRKRLKEVGFKSEEKSLTSFLRKKQLSSHPTSYWFEAWLIGGKLTDFGANPGGALAALLMLIFVFMWFYLRALQRPRKQAGIWRIRPPERIMKDEDEPDRELIKLEGFERSLWTAFYFSFLSAFRFGWKELNLSNWIVRIQKKEYTLQATGWVRMVSGIQSLISLYCVALFLLTYFGNPFE